MTQSFVWLSSAGGLVETEAARVPVTDRGFLLGDGLFETARIHGGRVPLVERHLRRLEGSARRLEIPIPWDLRAAIDELLAVRPLEVGVLRITVTRGLGPRGYDPPSALRPTVLVQAEPLLAPVEPADAMVASYRRDPRSPLAGMKVTSALPLVMARREARAAGCGEAVLVGVDGNLSEGDATNLFWVRDGVLYTPSLETGCLPGIGRALVLEHARACGIPAREVAWPPKALEEASEVFLTSAVRLVVPLRSLRLPDGRTIRFATDGPLVAEFRTALHRAVSVP